VWRSSRRRAESARERLRLARELWGWGPHRRQREWFCARAQVRVAACGRRWGKTEALAVDVATLALAEARAGRDCRQLVVAPTEAQARLIGGEALARLQEAFDREGEHTAGLELTHRREPMQITVAPPGAAARARNVKKARGQGPAVSRILCRTAGRDGRSLRGLWAHRIVVDEAGYVPDAVLTDVLLPMLTDVGGELALASSPAGRRGVFYRLFAQGQAVAPPAPNSGGAGRKGGRGGVTYQSFQCPSSDNPHLDKAFLRAMAEELGEASFAAEYGAQFVDEGGAVFREDDIAACLADDPRVSAAAGDLVSAPSAGRLYSVGVDWGRRRDFTVACVLDATERPARLVGLWRWRGTGWEAQAAAVARIVAAFSPVRVLADGNGVGDPVAERLSEAIRSVPAAPNSGGDGWTPPVERFVFTADSKQRLVDGLTLALSARALTYPAHRALLTELRAFEYGPPGPSGRAPMAARGGGHDDIVMALALAWHGAPTGAPPPPSEVILLGSQAGLPGRE